MRHVHKQVHIKTPSSLLCWASMPPAQIAATGESQIVRPTCCPSCLLTASRASFFDNFHVSQHYRLPNPGRWRGGAVGASPEVRLSIKSGPASRRPPCLLAAGWTRVSARTASPRPCKHRTRNNFEHSAQQGCIASNAHRMRCCARRTGSWGRPSRACPAKPTPQPPLQPSAEPACFFALRSGKLSMQPQDPSPL